MYITTDMNYTVRQFINDFLQEFGYFNYGTISAYCKSHGIQDEEGGCYTDDYFLPFWIDYGLSKACLRFDNKKVVIKIPLEEDGRYSRNKIEFFKLKVRNGRYIDFSKSSLNLCQREVDIYNAAKAENLADYFAAEKKIMIYHGVPVYAQEQIKIYYDSSEWEEDCGKELNGDISEILDDYLEKGDEIEEIVDQFAQNINFVEKLYAATGKARFVQFIDFLINQHINDLHNGNIGYSKNGTPKLMDYSGYNG